MRRLKRSTPLLQRSRNRFRGLALSHNGSALRYELSDNRVTRRQVLSVSAAGKKRELARAESRHRTQIAGLRVLLCLQNFGGSRVGCSNAGDTPAATVPVP
jgi:hypothetical protein